MKETVNKKYDKTGTKKHVLMDEDIDILIEEIEEESEQYAKKVAKKNDMAKKNDVDKITTKNKTESNRIDRHTKDTKGSKNIKSAQSEKNDKKVKSVKDTKDNKEKKKNKKLTIFLRVLATIGVTLAIAVIGLYGVCFVLVKGPSETAKNQFVCSVKETSAMGWVAHLFLSSEEINEIVGSRGIIEVDDGTVSNPGLIEIPKDDDDDNKNDETPDIQVIDITGTTYRGKLMIVKDPSRVFVGTVPEFKEGTGEVVATMAERYGAIGGINGGEFFDAGSYSYSALPVGCVIENGELTFGSMNTVYNISGFTKDNVFVIGKMTPKEALEMGVRDAVHTKWETGPFLVLNGEPLVVPDTSVYGGGKNPRTAIGQRADGAVLLLVVDGRQANSIGATFEELAYIMLEHGAVNASAMDGGTSTQMYYQGEVINSPYSPTGPRRCPTCFLVSAE